jgi:hypothetical protein
MKRSATALIALAVLLSACVSVGTDVKLERSDSFVAGQTTIQDAISALGQPSSRSEYPNGTVLLQWLGTQAVYISARSEHLAILFDQDGKMIRTVIRTDISN